MESKKVFLIPFSDYKDINPIDCGYQDCPPGFDCGPTARDYTILHFVVSGKGILCKRSGEETVEAGQCFIIRRGEIAYYKADDENPWSYIWLGFRTSLPLPEPLAYADIIDAKKYENVFLPLTSHTSNEPELAAFLCSKCWELFSLMPSGRDVFDNADLPQMARAFIENEYTNDIHVSEVAAMLHVDRTALSKAFKKQTGVSPQEYLCSCRLSAACRLIRGGGYTLSQIALMCGYKDYCNFSRMFSRTIGMSPREYAKNRLNTE